MSCTDSNIIQVSADGGQVAIQPGNEAGNSITVVEGTSTVIEVATVGPRGPEGPSGSRGSDGLSGAGEPFFSLITGELYLSTASIALSPDAHISASLTPYTGSDDVASFDIGALDLPWQSLYLTSSIVFTNGTTSLVTMIGTENKITIGQSVISTSSYGFDGDVTIIKKRGSYVDVGHTGSMEVHADGTNDIFTAVSSSTDYFKVNNNGIVVFGEFDILPVAVAGGLIYSGSDFFVGK